MATWRPQLRTFLIERFAEGNSLQRFVKDNFGDEVSGQVTWTASLTDQADTLIGVLLQQGLLEKLWPALRAERKLFVSEIQKLEQVWVKARATLTPNAETPLATGSVATKEGVDDVPPGPTNFAGVPESTWNKIPSEVRSQIERWFRAKTIGSGLAVVSTVISAGCTGWGIYLSDLKHEQQTYAYWRITFIANILIAAMSWAGLVGYGFRRFRIPRHTVFTANEETQWWEALDATRSMRAGQTIRLLGSIWVSKLSIDVAISATTLSIFILVTSTPLVRYFIFGSTP